MVSETTPERPVGLDGSAAGVPETKIKFEI